MNSQGPTWNRPRFNLRAFIGSNLSSARELSLKTDVSSVYYTHVLGCDLSYLRQGFEVIVQPCFLDMRVVDHMFYIYSLSL